MVERIKKYQWALSTVLIAFCIGTILFSGVRYLVRMEDKLERNEQQHIMDMTLVQKQAVNDYISSDRERMHRSVKYFSQIASFDPDEILRWLALNTDINAVDYGVLCLDEGLAYSSSSDQVIQLEKTQLEEYRSLTGSGVRDKFTGVFSGEPRFSYYETFTFANGHSGLLQKSYHRSAVTGISSLSVYNGLGYGYILDQTGDILRRSAMRDDGVHYDNIFDALTDLNYAQEDINALREALNTDETGSAILTASSGKQYAYSYAPLESAEGWYLLSIVSLEAISTEAQEIIQDSQIAVWLLIMTLILCIGVIFLIQYIGRNLADKDKKIEYQAGLFNVFFDYISENTDDVYMLLDPSGSQIEYSTPNLERVFGLSRQELIDSLQTFESTSTTGRKVNLESLRRMQPGMNTGDILVERTNRRTGERRWFLDRTRCTQIQGVNKLICYSSDRTRERKTQESLTEALHMANAASDAKSAFLSSVSHDIRTPMNAIIGFLALMKEEADNPAVVREYIQRIDTASQHLLGLINDVLDMSRIESGSATLSISEMNLADVISEINAIIRPQARAKNQTFDIFVPPLSHEQLLGDKMRINQILINLLSNAVKYTQEGGEVQFLVEELPQVMEHYSRVRFTVRDNGLGMSKEYQKVMFEPFTREETEATHEIQGTGLGMPITKSLVDLMGGTIAVESRQGEGSTFYIELELRIQKLEDDTRFWSEHKIDRIIVVDDDEETCLGIVKAMSRAGVAADYATAGHTAIQMVQERRKDNPYDLVLLDWKMPDLDGLETARLIRQDYPDKIPILLLTSYDWSDIEKEAIEAGVNHFMPKPFFMSTFKEAVRQITNGQEKRGAGQDEMLQGRHILVVDDVEVNRILLTKILTTLGAVCDTAANGQEAVDKFEASQPGKYDLIMMDVQMPVLNGYEATRAIRGGSHPSAKSVPIIAMTANAFVDDVRDALESGMDAHIAKPVQIDNLKATIQQVLDSRAGQPGGANRQESADNYTARR